MKGEGERGQERRGCVFGKSVKENWREKRIGK